MAERDRADDGKAEAGAAGGDAGRVEAVPDASARGGRQGGAAVGDGDADGGGAAGDGDVDGGAGPGELDGVGDEVVEGGGELSVAAGDDRVAGGGDVDRGGPRAAGALGGERGEVDGELDAAIVVDPCELEEARDQAIERSWRSCAGCATV